MPSNAAQIERLRAEREAASGLRDRPRAGTPHRLRDDRRLSGFGMPLPAALRDQAEMRLGVDLSRVRLHSDAEADAQRAEHKARAFTRGSQIAIGSKDLCAADRDAAQLLDHELGHAAQQAQAGSAPILQREGEDDLGIGRSPPEAIYEVDEGIGNEDRHALFEQDSAELSPTAQAALTAAARGYPPGILVTIHGYASLEGSDSYNLNLSAHRAVAIRNHLRTVMAQDTEFQLVAHGETDHFGEAGDNRRGGVDFLDMQLPDPATLKLPPLGVQPPGFRLAQPWGLQLTPPSVSPIPDPDAAPNISLPFLGAIDANSPLLDEPALGPRRPQPDPLFLRPAPSLFTQEFDFGASAGEFAARGRPLTTGDAAALVAHYEFWRLRFFQWGLSPERASAAAQMGTDLAAATQASLEAPYRHEAFDRRFGTEPPPTLTILNEDRMRWLFNKLSQGDD
jgi:outer membrane protein OmpA-like peptidoglycan-associated protein